MTIQLTLLPRELQVLILCRLDLRDCSVLTSVCHSLHDLVRGTPSLQYPIELAAGGMCDNPHGTDTSISEHLKNLRLHLGAWFTLRWTSDMFFHAPPGNALLCEQGLVMFEQKRDSLIKGIGFNVHQLPASTRNVVYGHWTVTPGIDKESSLGSEVYAVRAPSGLSYGMLMRGRMVDGDCRSTPRKTYSFFGGVKHPPKLTLTSTHYRRDCDTHSQSARAQFIRGDWICVLDRDVMIFTWKTGRRSTYYSTQARLTDCIFLDDSHLAVMVAGISPSPAVLLVYELPNASSDGDALYPSNLPVLAFVFPAIHDASATRTEWRLTCGSASSAARSSRAGAGDFCADPKETMIMVLFRLGDLGYELIVPTRRLLEFLPGRIDDIHISRTMFSSRDVPWSEWGPRYAYLRSATFDEGALRATIFGMRRVLHRPIISGGKLAVVVQDLFRPRVLHAAATSSLSYAVCRSQPVVGPWLDSATIQTEVSYVETVQELPISCQGKDPQDVGVSINEDGLVITGSNEAIVETHTF
ncbi:unnamed protein product [Peniophora sp. CBMAI 1063]|nr:unnamed protein product [Peniophora sp. CBMAI 1063]